jgi:hypothetical protein
MDVKRRKEIIAVCGGAIALLFGVYLFVWMSNRTGFCYQNIGSTMDYSCAKWVMQGGDCIANWAPASCEWSIKCMNGTVTYEPCEGCC